MTYLLAIDQGTTSTRSILFGAGLRPVATSQEEIKQIYKTGLLPGFELPLGKLLVLADRWACDEDE